jgi:hypothetical protein
MHPCLRSIFIRGAAFRGNKNAYVNTEILKMRLLCFNFRQTVTGTVDVFGAMTMPARHLVGLDDPVMGATRAAFAFPSFRYNKFVIFGLLQRTVPHNHLHLNKAVIFGSFSFQVGKPTLE